MTICLLKNITLMNLKTVLDCVCMQSSIRYVENIHMHIHVHLINAGIYMYVEHKN
jgi:hypothetical protein